MYSFEPGLERLVEADQPSGNITRLSFLPLEDAWGGRTNAAEEALQSNNLVAWRDEGATIHFDARSGDIVEVYVDAPVDYPESAATAALQHPDTKKFAEYHSAEARRKQKLERVSSLLGIEAKDLGASLAPEASLDVQVNPETAREIFIEALSQLPQES